MTLRIRALVGVLAATVVISASSAEDYDLVITNGRVMDPETMYDSIANVGISAGRIAVITRDKISGKRAIDATGHVVAPGFIDTHWHYDRPWSNKLALRDGRTSVMDLEVGTHFRYIPGTDTPEANGIQELLANAAALGASALANHFNNPG